ncbi:Protein-lysine N-methyltransferase rrg1 [Smittium mucronatum]|uniref:Protein-lysine N-methyltransferase rrg1 n=1 Tax=Smittium mucronatum TaxID=133383 RepID=A0A1R0H333_9FUNG|nr:Protein-lysine N-methyltransferase rrg1 [Smittium mucronatum]
MSKTLEIPPTIDKNKTDYSNILNTLSYLKSQLKLQRGFQNNSQESFSIHYPWDLSDSTEKSWCINWLQSLIKSASKQLMVHDSPESLEQLDSIISQVSDIISELCGEGASNPKQVSIRLWNSSFDPFDVILNEPSYQEADLGSKTWGSSILLSRFISRNPSFFSQYTKIIELGSGTGLCGISLCKILQEYPKTFNITITDFLDPLLFSISSSFKINLPESIPIKQGSFQFGQNSLANVSKLDWFDVNSVISDTPNQDNHIHIQPPQANYFDVSQNMSVSSFDTFPLKDSRDSYDLIIASDVLYEIQHALIIPKVVHLLLLKNEIARNSFLNAFPDASNFPIIPSFINPTPYLDKLSLSKVPLFLITAPLRKTHWAEINTFESTMIQFGFKCIFYKDTSLSQDLENWYLSNPNSTENNREKISSNTISDDLIYRIYFWI